MDIGSPLKRKRVFPLQEPVPDNEREPKFTPPEKAPTKEPEKVE